MDLKAEKEFKVENPLNHCYICEYNSIEEKYDESILYKYRFDEKIEEEREREREREKIILSIENNKREIKELTQQILNIENLETKERYIKKYEIEDMLDKVVNTESK